MSVSRKQRRKNIERSFETLEVRVAQIREDVEERLGEIEDLLSDFRSVAYPGPAPRRQSRARRWFRRVVLRRRPSLLERADRILRDEYAPVIREQLNRPSVLFGGDGDPTLLDWQLYRDLNRPLWGDTPEPVEPPHVTFRIDTGSSASSDTDSALEQREALS